MKRNRGGKRSVTKAEINALREILVKRYPRCFVPVKTEKFPISVSLHKDLKPAVRAIDPTISMRIIRSFLYDYTTGVRYLRNLVRGRHKVDLQGWPAGVISHLEEVKAKEALRKREEWIEHRRAERRRLKEEETAG